MTKLELLLNPVGGGALGGGLGCQEDKRAGLLQLFLAQCRLALLCRHENVLRGFKTSPQPSPNLGEGVRSLEKERVINYSCVSTVNSLPSCPLALRKCLAFTLAEVLITLTIIGIVAAMTMPTLIQNHQKKVAATRLKQACSQINQAIQMAQVEYGDYSGWDEANPKGSYVEDGIDSSILVKVFADKYILPYLKLTSEPERASLKSKGYKTGIMYNKTEQYVSELHNFYFAELANGTTLMFANNGNGTTNIVRTFIIFIDINGPSGENRAGHDFFAIQFDAEKGFNFPYQGRQNEEQLYSSCKKGSFFTCTELLMRHGWKIDDRYPW